MNHQAKDSINITHHILDQIFKVLDEEDISVKQIIPCFATLSKKSEDDIVNFVKKSPNFVKKN